MSYTDDKLSQTYSYQSKASSYSENSQLLPVSTLDAHKKPKKNVLDRILSKLAPEVQVADPRTGARQTPLHLIARSP